MTACRSRARSAACCRQRRTRRRPIRRHRPTWKTAPTSICSAARCKRSTVRGDRKAGASRPFFLAGLYSPVMIPKDATASALELARKVLAIEADAVRALIARLDDRFLAAVSLILACKGRVIVSGIGKSGHIARKIASTLSSTGTPAYFVHPAEASHGDLGMITRGDVLV